MARGKHPEITQKRIVDAAQHLFLQQGYEKTTIQDILTELGDLSKGAIYHHFKGKEEIMDAVTTELFQGLLANISQLKGRSDLTGLQKLQRMAGLSLQNPQQQELITAVPDLLKNPRFLTEQLYSSIHDVAPMIQVFVEEGIADGSVQTEYPKELSEVLILLANIWLNPLVFVCTEEDLARKFRFFQALTKGLGLVLFDEKTLEMMEAYRKLAARAAAT